MIISFYYIIHMNKIYNIIENLKVIPVASIENLDFALELGKVLNNSNLPIVEITFRTEIAKDIIFNLTKEYPNLLVGAGTVLNIKQVKKAVNNGAKFIVTPGFNSKLVDYCIDNNIFIIPGINTPTFIEWGLERKLKVLKFFPAEVSGGISFLEAISGPYPSEKVKFIPTGGINNINFINYLKMDNVLACAGSWLVKGSSLQAIESRIKETYSLIKAQIK